MVRISIRLVNYKGLYQEPRNSIWSHLKLSINTSALKHGLQNMFLTTNGSNDISMKIYIIPTVKCLTLDIPTNSSVIDAQESIHTWSPGYINMWSLAIPPSFWPWCWGILLKILYFMEKCMFLEIYKRMLKSRNTPDQFSSYTYSDYGHNLYRPVAWK